MTDSYTDRVMEAQCELRAENERLTAELEEAHKRADASDSDYLDATTELRQKDAALKAIFHHPYGDDGYAACPECCEKDDIAGKALGLLPAADKQSATYNLDPTAADKGHDADCASGFMVQQVCNCSVADKQTEKANAARDCCGYHKQGGDTYAGCWEPDADKQEITDEEIHATNFPPDPLATDPAATKQCDHAVAIAEGWEICGACMRPAVESGQSDE